MDIASFRWMENHRKEFGSWGERYVQRILIKNGYRVLHCNWYCHWGEIDIVAEKSGRIYFFEVKTRKTDVLESISPAKLKHLWRSIQIYLKKYGHSFENFQVDFIGLETANSKTKLIRLQNVLEERR